MSRHREAIENISKQLNLVCYEDGMIEKLAPVWKAIAEAEQILKSEYREGDKEQDKFAHEDWHKIKKGDIVVMKNGVEREVIKAGQHTKFRQSLVFNKINGNLTDTTTYLYADLCYKIDRVYTPPQKEEAPLSAKMNSDRIKEIQSATAYPNSVSVHQALLQVWNECMQQYAHRRDPDKLAEEIIDNMKRDLEIHPYTKNAISQTIKEHLK